MFRNCTNQLIGAHDFFEIVHVLEHHSNHYFSPAMEKQGTEIGFWDAQSIRGLNYSTEWKECRKEHAQLWWWGLKNCWLDGQIRPISFTWIGATYQCTVKWPGWMSSKKAMGHVSSFKFGHFLLSGSKRNMCPRCGNTFWQDSRVSVSPPLLVSQHKLVSVSQLSVCQSVSVNQCQWVSHWLSVKNCQSVSHYESEGVSQCQSACVCR